MCCYHPLPAVIGNACGTIGIIHCVANVCTATGGSVPLRACSELARFVWLIYVACTEGKKLERPPSSRVAIARVVGVSLSLLCYTTGPDSYFDKFITRTLAMTPGERAVALEDDDEVS